MKTYLLTSIKLTVILIVLCSVVYPLAIAGIATLAPGKGNGVTISANGKIVGYENIGQSFTGDAYFWSRPSAVSYNAAGSAGSNKGPSCPDYLAAVQARIDTFLVHNPGISKAELPAEMVTASGSGLDPDISPESALVQLKRVATARNIAPEKIRQLIAEHTEGPVSGLFGPEKINVLKLNIALDNLK